MRGREPGRPARETSVRRAVVVYLACLLAGTALATGGCSFFEAPPQIRGNRVDAEQLKQLVPGTSTKTDVTALLGSPTTHASFDDNTWIYIGGVTRPRIGQIQGVESQDVVVAKFDDAGVLRSVRHLTEKDAEPVSVVARTTPSPGTDATFLQQLFGNVGRFSPLPGATGGGLGGEAFGPGGSNF
jgi:outer membrane protein assembly factor BamE (lipoprotein component of BamABCDE complex)